VNARLTGRAAGAWGLVLALFGSACDGQGPEGPGFVDVTIGGPTAVGAAVVNVSGGGVTAFEGAGGSRVFAAPLPPEVHRVVVVGESGAHLRFRVRVEDRGATLPTVVLLSVVDDGNLPVWAGDYEATVAR